MTKTWFSPFPRIQRADTSSVETLSEVDQQIQSIERLVSAVTLQKRRSHKAPFILDCESEKKKEGD
jgi:hypothetical protein